MTLQVEEVEKQIRDYFDNVTEEQFEKDFEEVEQMPSSKCDVKLFEVKP